MVMVEKKQDEDSIFLRLPPGKQIKFIELAKNVLFIKLMKAKVKRKVKGK